MGCPELDMTSYFRFIKPDENPCERLESSTEKTSYSRFSHPVVSNFRYYSPEMGRWTGRDPMEGWGGYNLYLMCHNNVFNKYDLLGLVDFLGVDISIEYNAQKEVDNHTRKPGNRGVTLYNASVICICTGKGNCTLKCTIISIPTAYVSEGEGSILGDGSAEHEVRHALAFLKGPVAEVMNDMKLYEGSYKTPEECQRNIKIAEDIGNRTIKKYEDWEYDNEYTMDPKTHYAKRLQPLYDYPEPVEANIMGSTTET